MEGETQNEVTPNPVGFPGATQTPIQNGSKKNWKWLVILVLFLVVIGGVTFFVFKSSRQGASEEASPTPDTSTLTNIATPAPTTLPTGSPVDKSQISVKVLNGTGIPGEAGLLADQLKNLGYTDVTTGNASAQNTTTTVSFSPSISQDVITEITAKLNAIYTNVATSNTAPSGSDVQIIVGLRKGQTSIPSATTAPTTAPTSAPTATSSPTATP